MGKASGTPFWHVPGRDMSGLGSQLLTNTRGHLVLFINVVKVASAASFHI